MARSSIAERQKNRTDPNLRSSRFWMLHNFRLRKGADYGDTAANPSRIGASGQPGTYHSLVRRIRYAIRRQVF